ncbi:MAG TPA: ABC transporter permease [Acidimicrobiia bacterium]|nr:ABC transporter permease [Acidimicrobiia bacterium]HZQ76237.1 ABC transporter permease [Acidimicrobiia bacterium]
MTQIPNSTTRIITAQGSVPRRLREIAHHRELLVNLVRLELKAKYKSSTLGFFWSLLNPAMYLVVFYVAFNVILGAGIPRFAIYLLAGLLVWNFFSAAVTAGTASIVSGAGLVKKIWFPREILPLASTGAALVHFFLQSLVLVVTLVALRHPVGWLYLTLLPLALLDLILLTSALSVLLAAANVYLRDIQHFVELALLAWFWVTPVVYLYSQLTTHLGGRNIALINPVTPIVLTFQRAFYGLYGHVIKDVGFGWYLRNLVVLAVAVALLFYGAMWVFLRLEGNLAEEL